MDDGGQDAAGRGRPRPRPTTFEWLEGGGYLVQRAVMDDPVFPRGVMLIGPASAASASYSTTSTRAAWRASTTSASRTASCGCGATTPDFAQRYSGRLSADGTTIEGAWERCRDGTTWEHDFDLTYQKVRVGPRGTSRR